MKRLRLEGIALQWLAELLDQLEERPAIHARLTADEKSAGCAKRAPALSPTSASHPR